MLKDKDMLAIAISVKKKIRNGIELENNLVNAQRWAQILRMRSHVLCVVTARDHIIWSLCFLLML